jgi:hypothetical protein
MKRLFVLALGATMLPLPALASDVKRASERFAAADTEEVPDFQRHVLPLLGRLGCNGRSCHGSFQGQGGFRLSLFGYDLKADRDALMGDDKKKRTDVESPEDSLVVQKPTLMVPHKGGRRMDAGSWQYNLLVRWIETGAKQVAADAAHFDHLEVTPREIVFKKPGETVQLKAVAHWSDGTKEDVTELCRFRTNDESLAQISEAGLVTALGKGDTHVVAFYDNGVSPVQVMLPVSDRVGPRYPDVPAPTRIDRLVIEKLRKLGVVPSELANDTEFLRRVALDITGTLPTPQEIEAFLQDKAADKRSRKIDELLERPAYAAWWATIFCDITGNNPRTLQFMQDTQTAQWYSWIHRRIQDNVSYDKLIAGIVLATGRKPGQSYDDYVQEMASYFRTQGEKGDYAGRETMPLYWARRTVRQPDDAALNFAYTFLGIRLQCAQCHKHPFDQWTQQDFKQFSAFFNRVAYNIRREDAARAREIDEKAGLAQLKNNNERQRKQVELVNAGTPISFQEVYISPPANAGRAAPKNKTARRPQPQPGVTARVLGGREVDVNQIDDPRQALMDWMRQKDNPYFARAFVNRVWGHYFGVGIVEPVDDQNLANPPSNAALLDYLSQAFIDHGYDMKWLHREICNSRTYQLSWKPNDTNRLDGRNFSHALIRRLPAEVAVDAVAMATASVSSAEEAAQDPSRRAISETRTRQPGRNQANYALRVFGQPARATTCDCERSNEPNLAQSLFLMNDTEIFTVLDRRDGRLQELTRQVEREKKTVDPDQLVQEFYLRTLSRYPTSAEVDRAKEHLGDSKTLQAGARDLLWALLNTKEFIVNK